MKEEWKEHPYHKGLLVSTLGRIKLPEVKAYMPHGGERSYKTKPTFGVVTKASKTAKHEYYGLMNRKLGNLKIHKLVCETYHGLKPFDKAVVIHKDENGLNNKYDNLKWGTQKENLNAPGFIQYCESRTGINNPLVKGKMK